MRAGSARDGFGGGFAARMISLRVAVAPGMTPPVRGLQSAAMSAVLGYWIWSSLLGFLFWILLLLAFVALITSTVMFVYRAFAGGRGPSPAPASPVAATAAQPAVPSAREILDRRLASGEITPQQYDEVLVRLQAGGPSG